MKYPSRKHFAVIIGIFGINLIQLLSADAEENIAQMKAHAERDCADETLSADIRKIRCDTWLSLEQSELSIAQGKLAAAQSKLAAEKTKQLKLGTEFLKRNIGQ